MLFMDIHVFVDTHKFVEWSHRQQTIERMKGQDIAFSFQDTTKLDYTIIVISASKSLALFNESL